MVSYGNVLAGMIAAALALGIVVACTSSETVAPEDAEITVSGNPTTIVLASGSECASLLNVASCGTSEIVATVSNSIGVPLPEQDVRFSSSAGLLFTGDLSAPQPASNIPIPTDKFGNARVSLISSTTTTVTARSGAASGTVTLSTVQGNLTQILLNNDTASCPTSSTNITSCSQIICLAATAEDDMAMPVPGVVILFELRNNVSGMNTFNVTFSQSQVTTDANGEAKTTFQPDSTCAMQCGGSKPCQGEVVARTQGGLLSSPLQLTINIP